MSRRLRLGHLAQLDYHPAAWSLRDLISQRVYEK